jgi:TonB C terminal
MPAAASPDNFGGRAPPRLRLAWKTGYESDEIAIGVALAIALHLIPIGLIFIKAKFPTILPTEVEPPAKTVVAATLLKLGKPLDPKQLPDRIVPQARTAPHKEVVASRDEPKKPNLDAGLPPPDTKNSDIQKLISKTDPFAEDAGKVRPEIGHTEGVEGGTEQDPSKVHAGDMYATKLAQFLRSRWTMPSVISKGEERKLCGTFQVSVSPRMVIWHLRQEAVKKSGNDLFDDSARETLQKLLDDRTPLPDPPDAVADAFRGKTVNITMQGEGARCD